MKHRISHKQPYSPAKKKAWRLAALLFGIALLVAGAVFGILFLHQKNAAAPKGNGAEALQSAAPAANSPAQGGETAAQQSPQASPSQTPQISGGQTQPPNTAAPTAVTTTKQTPTEYEAYLTLRESLIYGMLRIRYQNESGADLYAVALNLFANAASARCLKVTDVSVNKKPLAFSYGDDAHTVLVAPLYREMKNGEATEIFVEFTLSIPQGAGLLGYDSAHTSLSAVLPRIAPVESGILRETPLQSGDAPTELSDFRIALDAGSEMVTSPEIAVLEANGLWYIAANDEPDILIQTRREAS